MTLLIKSFLWRENAKKKGVNSISMEAGEGDKGPTKGSIIILHFRGKYGLILRSVSFATRGEKKDE